MFGFISLFLPVLSIAAVAFSIIGASAAVFLLNLSITLTVLFVMIGIFVIRRKAQWMSVVFSGGLWFLPTLISKIVQWIKVSFKPDLDSSTGILNTLIFRPFSIVLYGVLYIVLFLFLLILLYRLRKFFSILFWGWIDAIREAFNEINFERLAEFTTALLHKFTTAPETMNTKSTVQQSIPIVIQEAQRTKPSVVAATSEQPKAYSMYEVSKILNVSPAIINLWCLTLQEYGIKFKTQDNSYIFTIQDVADFHVIKSKLEEHEKKTGKQGELIFNAHTGELEYVSVNESEVVATQSTKTTSTEENVVNKPKRLTKGGKRHRQAKKNDVK